MSMTPSAKATAATAVVFAAVLYACGGGGPTAPTAPTPAGCSGEAINNIAIGFGGGGSADQVLRFTATAFGETINGQVPPVFSGFVKSVVPCDYEVTGQILDPGKPLRVMFGFAPGQRAPDRGGIEPSSISVVEGPSPRIFSGSGSGPACQVEFGSSGSRPADFRIRFRVVPGITEGARC